MTIYIYIRSSLIDLMIHGGIDSPQELQKARAKKAELDAKVGSKDTRVVNEQKE